VLLIKNLLKNLSSQAYAHVFSANFALDCVKNPCRAASPPADFCLVLDKIMLENPHTFLVKTGSKYKNKKHGKYVGFGQKLHITKKKRLSFLQLRNVLTILLYLTKK
jgi:hypothetical protein